MHGLSDSGAADGVNARSRCRGILDSEPDILLVRCYTKSSRYDMLRDASDVVIGPQESSTGHIESPTRPIYEIERAVGRGQETATPRGLSAFCRLIPFSEIQLEM